MWNKINNWHFIKADGCDAENPSYIGCYKDDDKGDLQFKVGSDQSSYNPSSCNLACQKYKYFALKNFGKECWCGDAYGTEEKYKWLPDGECGDANGKPSTNAVFQTCAVKGKIQNWLIKLSEFFCD